MLYAWPFSKNIEIPIVLKGNKFYFYLSTYNTLFDWGGGNSFRNRSYTG